MLRSALADVADRMGSVTEAPRSDRDPYRIVYRIKRVLVVSARQVGELELELPRSHLTTKEPISMIFMLHSDRVRATLSIISRLSFFKAQQLHFNTCSSFLPLSVPGRSSPPP